VHGLPFKFFPALPPPAGVPRIPVPPAARGDFAVIHPFASGPRKRWPLEDFRVVAAQLGMPVRWCAGPEDELAEAVRIADLYELGCWISQARVFIGNDSGISHLAAAVGTPVVAIFLSTDPLVWTPRGERIAALVNPRVEEVVSAARKVSQTRPLWVKLGPLVTDIALIASSAEAAGADALTVANTYPAMAVDVSTGKSLLGNTTGGLSGPAIKPITLRLVWETRKAVKIPVVGLGGIETADDVLQYMAVGASAVQVGTASFSDPKASEEIVAGLPRALDGVKALSFNEIRERFLAENG